jgi:hypothetical protein
MTLGFRRMNMFCKKGLISSMALLSLVFSAVAESAVSGADSDGVDRSGSTRFTGDRDTSQDRTLSTPEYFSSKLKAGKVKAPGVPTEQIQGDTPPPGNNSMSRMIREDDRDGSLMGGHE